MLDKRSTITIAILLGAHCILPCFANVSQAQNTFLERKIAGFQPVSDNSDVSVIDMDQKEMEELLRDISTSDLESFAYNFEFARKIYSQGGHSRPYADLDLERGIPISIMEGELVIGQSPDGDDVIGRVVAPLKAGDDSVKILYSAHHIFDAKSRCLVGGRPSPEFEGCFNTTGEIEIEGYPEPLSYRYDMSTHNQNQRNLKELSRKNNVKMKGCNGGRCPYFKDFTKFVDFYGTFAYGDNFVHAAFEGTQATLDNVADDFSTISIKGIAAFIRRATVLMHVSMHVLSELEMAIVHCEKACDLNGCNNHHLRNLDAAVSFYAGSLVGPEGDQPGAFLYSIANSLCGTFRTCGPDGKSTSGKAKVNYDIFEQFDQMQDHLQNRQCPDARRNKERVAHLLFVPMIQGTLAAAYRRAEAEISVDAAKDIDLAEGAAFSASVIPVVAACADHDAQSIYQSMFVSSSPLQVNYQAVKESFERHYSCMGLTCEDIGGVVGADGTYALGAEPCIPESEIIHGSEDLELKRKRFGSSVVVLAFTSLLVVVCIMRRKRGNRKRTKGRGDGMFSGGSGDDNEDYLSDDSEEDFQFKFT